MRTLLTGSSGWLGRFLKPMLEAHGHTVCGLDVAPSRWTDVQGSVADGVLINRLFVERAFDAVIHCGGLHKPDIARYPAQAFVDVNVTGTLNLLNAARANAVSRFVFTSTTSLMISQAIRDGSGEAAWLDETSGPLIPRNIYGVTKLAAEGLCRIAQAESGLPCIVLRTGRFFPEDDDTLTQPSGKNLKANEFLNRRLTVEDAAAAHIAALKKAPEIGFGLYIVAAPTPFDRADIALLTRDPAAAIARHFPDAAALYAQQGWTSPSRIDRVYDTSLIQRDLGFRCETDFAAILAALREGTPMPFAHDPNYISPQVALEPCA